MMCIVADVPECAMRQLLHDNVSVGVCGGGGDVCFPDVHDTLATTSANSETDFKRRTPRRLGSLAQDPHRNPHSSRTSELKHLRRHL